MELELLVCGDYCPITGLKIVGYRDEPRTMEQVVKSRERQRRNYTPEKRRLKRIKEKSASNIPT